MKWFSLTLALVLALSACASDDVTSTETQGNRGNAPIRGVSVRKVVALTGPEAPDSTKDVDLCSTDIGTMTELGGKIFYAFGDSFGYDGDFCKPFGPNWRSNLLGNSSDLNPEDGIIWDGWYTGADGKAIAVSEGAHEPAFAAPGSEGTRIPTAMVTVGERLYMHYMSVHGFSSYGGQWLCNFSRFVYSDDAGESWTEAAGNFGTSADRFNMLALSPQAGEGNPRGRYVYAVGTPCGRFGGARVGRVRAEKLLDNSAWEYFDGKRWSKTRNDAVEVIKPPVGEGSLIWNEGVKRWMYTYLNEDAAALELRLARNPWGPWDAPLTLARGADYPALYGAFMTPSFIKNNGETFYFVMSQFGPYNTYIMEATLETR